MHRFIFVVTVYLWALTAIAQAQSPTVSDLSEERSEPDSASIWQQASLPLVVAEDGLDGPAADWLRARTAASQFILFGEQHGVEGVAETVTAAYTEFYDQGFTFLALEAGPWITQRYSDGPVDAALMKWPYSLAFDYDGDVELLETVEARFDVSGQKIWGLDQSITAIHPLQRLQKLPRLRKLRASPAARS